MPLIWGSRPVWRYRLYRLYLFHDCRSFYTSLQNISNQDPRHHAPAQFLRRSCWEYSIVNASMALNLQGDLNCKNDTAFSSWRADRRQLQLDEITGGRCLELNMWVSFFLVVPSSRYSAARCGAPRPTHRMPTDSGATQRVSAHFPH